MRITKILILIEFCAIFLFNSVYATEPEMSMTRETHYAVALEKAPRVLEAKDKTSKLIDNDLKRIVNLRKDNES